VLGSSPVEGEQVLAVGGPEEEAVVDAVSRAERVAVHRLELTGLSLRTVRRRIADETLRSPTSLVEIGDSPLQIWRDCNVARQYRARHAVSMSVRRADAPVVPISASCSSSVTR